jgi:hypothetical protein
MKRLIRWIFLIPLFAAFILPTPALAGGLFDDRIIFGSNFTLDTGETLDGNLLVFGGNATLRVDSLVTGDVVLMGGNLDAAGHVEGNVVGLGGLVSLGETAVVDGDVTALGAQLDRAAGARIGGSIITNLDTPLSFTFPGSVQVPRFDIGFSPIINVAGYFLKILLWTALAVLLTLFLPEKTMRIGQTALAQPLVSGGLGLLTVVVLPVLVLALAITILLIPVSLIVVVLALLAWMYGLTALGLEVGKRLALLFKQEWAPAAAAGAGTFILMMVLDGLAVTVPCLGWIFPTLAGMVGLGAVLVTRFGTQDYPAYATPVAPPTPVVPEVAPEAPAPPTLPAADDNPPQD